MADTLESLVARLNVIELQVAALQQQDMHVGVLIQNLHQLIGNLRNELNQLSAKQTAVTKTLETLHPGFETKFEQTCSAEERKQQNLAVEAVRGVVEHFQQKLR